MLLWQLRWRVMVEFTYDPEADAAYLKLNDSAIPADRTVVLELPAGDLNVDLDAGGRVLGLEFLAVEALLGGTTADALLERLRSQ